MENMDDHEVIIGNSVADGGGAAIGSKTADNTIKHPGGRPISVPWRFDENHNIIIMNPTKRDYNINYYKNIKSTCELCNRQVVWKHMKRHQMSDIEVEK